MGGGGIARGSDFSGRTNVESMTMAMTKRMTKATRIMSMSNSLKCVSLLPLLLLGGLLNDTHGKEHQAEGGHGNHCCLKHLSLLSLSCISCCLAFLFICSEMVRILFDAYTIWHRCSGPSCIIALWDSSRKRSAQGRQDSQTGVGSS